MTNWQIAKVLIDAKKEIDSIWYIAVNEKYINGDIKKILKEHRKLFYIFCVVVIDKSTSNKERKYLKDNNEIIKKLFYYRDKYAAHRDDNFVDSDFLSIMDIVNECIKIIKEVKKCCESSLPNNISLDFLCYNAELFRNIYGITKEKEIEIRKTKYPLYQPKENYPKEILENTLYDIDEIYKMEGKKDFWIYLEGGLTLEENIQRVQDFCIEMNISYNTELWEVVDYKQYRKRLMRIKLGYDDVFCRKLYPNKTDAQIKNDLYLLEKAKEYLVFDLSINHECIKEAIYGR